MNLVITNNSDSVQTFIFYEGKTIELQAKESQSVTLTEEEFLKFVAYYQPKIVTQETATESSIFDFGTVTENFSINDIFTISVSEAPAKLDLGPGYLKIPVWTGLQLAGKIWNGSLEYSVDNGQTWEDAQNAFQSSDYTYLFEKRNSYGYSVLLRGTGNTKFGIDNYSSNEALIEGINGPISGSLGALLDYKSIEEGVIPKSGYACFSRLFQNTGASFSDDFYYCPVTTNLAYYNTFVGCNISRIMDFSLYFDSNTKFYDSAFEFMYYDCSNIKVSDVETAEYQYPFVIPGEPVDDSGKDALNSMFSSTGGTFKSTPTFNTTYWTDKPLQH